MHLNELHFFQDKHDQLGFERSLTVVTDTRKVSSSWILRDLAGVRESLLVCFTKPTVEKQSYKGKLLDLYSSLFRASASGFEKPSLDTIYQQIIGQKVTRVLLQHPDILLASEAVTDAELVSFIFKLLQSHQVVVSLLVDSGLNESPLGIGRSQNALLTKTLHQANLVLTLREFPTGKASDYTGFLRVSAGPKSLDQVFEQDFLYTVQGTGAVRLEKKF